jgi:hypothetical protein
VRISVQAALPIEQAQSGRRNHSLFQWPASMSLSGLKVGDGVDAMAERTLSSIAATAECGHPQMEWSRHLQRDSPNR